MPRDPDHESFRRSAEMARFTRMGNKALKGRTIKTVFYLSPAETGLDQGGPAIVLDDGAVLVIQSDDEGNAPGVIRYIPSNDTDRAFLLPRI